MDEYKRLLKKLDEETFFVNVEHTDISSSSMSSFGVDSTDPNTKSSTITFTFSLKNVLTRFTLKPGFGAEKRDTRNLLPKQDYILIDLDQFRRGGNEGRENARQIIDQKLKSWRQIPDNWRQQWIEMALDKARAVVTFMPPTHDTVSINFNATMASTSLLDREKEATLLNMFAEIENFVKANPDPCAICSTQFYGHSEYVSTACRHNFHGDCLTNWLRNNPDCPICHRNISRRS